MREVLPLYAYTVAARRLSLWQDEVLGMPLLRVELPRRLTPRTCRRVERWLGRAAVHEMLNHPDHWPGSPLPPLTPTRPLWREKAAETALALLKQDGVPPSCATVEVCGDRFSDHERATILALLPRVRALSLSLPAPEEFLWLLQREYGVCPLSGPGHLALCFAPASRARVLPLWDARPRIPGVDLTAPLPELPPECPRLPLLAALFSQGHIGAEAMHICADFS